MRTFRVVASVAFTLWVSFGSVVAQDTNGDGSVTYLLPLNVPNAVAGAYGSEWKTELWVHNGSSTPYDIQGCPGLNVGGVSLCEGVPFHPPGITEQAYPYETGENGPGALNAFTFNVSSSQSGIIVRSRLYELSKHAQPAGVEIPVIREDEFFTDTSRFIGVPNNSVVRVALRVYDPMHIPGSAARVEIFDKNGTVLGSTILPLIPQTVDAISPGYAAILDVASAFPQLAGIDHFDIKVTPIQSTRAYWAFVSVTDLNTQTVLLVTSDK